tara:strand:- start:5556 stop:5789 length:234 start_codon:yes stop_codon:yes gene_type:complete
MDNLDDTVFLPLDDEYFGQNISIFKNTFIVKDVDNYKFLYLLICNTCIDAYLKKHGRIYKYLRNRELGIKEFHKKHP